MKKGSPMIYISHLLPDEEMRDVIEKTGAGVESIEFSVSENLDHLSESIRSYKKRLQMMGTEKLTIHGPFLDLNPMAFDKEIYRVTKMRYEQAYIAACELGARKIVYHTCLYPDAYLLIGWADRVAEFYREFLQNKKEMEIVLENVFDRKWEPLKEVVEKVGMPNFRLCFDAGHANCFSEAPICDWTENLGNYITHLHLHDNSGSRDSHLGLGCGNVPVDRIFYSLRGRAFTCAIECGTREGVMQSYCRLLQLGYKE